MRLRVTSLLLLVLSGTPALAQWTWLYPKPQPHTLNDIVFLDNTTAIAVGELGTLIVTHDAGATWTVKTKVANVVTELLRIDRVDASTAVAVGRGGVILRTDDQGITWNTMASDIASDLVDVSFVNETHGMAITANRALRTSNGGLTWLSATVVTPPLKAVDMLTPLDALAVGDYGAVRTTDGGATWINDASLSGYFMAVDFRDPLHGVVGSTFQSYVTSNGGVAWSPFCVDPYGCYAVHFQYTPNEFLHLGAGILVAALRGLYTGPDGSPFETPFGELNISTNSGANWTIAGMTPRQMNGLARNQDGVVITVGDDGQIFRRETDGAFHQIGGSAGDYQWGTGGLSFLSPDIGIVMSSDEWNYRSGSSTFVRTTDGGATWAVSHLGGMAAYDLAHLSPGDVYAVGVSLNGSGSVANSIDGGATWAVIWTTPLFRLGSIAAGSAAKAVAVGTGGGAVTIDNGVISVASTGTTSSLYGVSFATQMNVVAVGEKGTVIRSVDGGHAWELVPSGTTADLYDVDFVSGNTGFVLGNGLLLGTGDGGLTWNLISPTLPASFIALDFHDDKRGIAVGFTTSAWTTVDGGRTWNILDRPTNRYFFDAQMVSASHAYIAGPDQMLLGYRVDTVPTLISSFDAAAEPFATVLRWSVRDEADLARFMIRRGDQSSSVERTIVDDLSSTARSFRDESVSPGQTYEYQLVAVEGDGTTIPSAPVSLTIPGASLELLPNQPNPFNPSTTLRFVVPERGPVRLAVYDIAGRHVVTLVDDTRDAGVHSVEWNGVNAGRSRVASGVYVTRLEAGKQTATRKIVLLK